MIWFYSDPFTKEYGNKAPTSKDLILSLPKLAIRI
jgi:hypothetical protein